MFEYITKELYEYTPSRTQRCHLVNKKTVTKKTTVAAKQGASYFRKIKVNFPSLNLETCQCPAKKLESPRNSSSEN